MSPEYIFIFMEKLPRHVAIIMDGNGRWAKKRRLARIMGHREGVETAKKISERCLKRGIKALTLYTFSTENWKRPRKEVDRLMNLLLKALEKGEKEFVKNDVRFNVIGRLKDLPQALRARLVDLMHETRSNDKMILTLALNYGGRQEILDAVRSMCEECRTSSIDVPSLNEDDFRRFLYTKDLPDPDLIIRTSGEMRLSNFLLWQAAYSELYVTDTLWPDFTVEELERIFKEYAKRERKFGG